MSYEGLVFKPKQKTERYQVRFWSTPNMYATFTDQCEREGLGISDVFNQFMLWFTEKRLVPTAEHADGNKEN